MKTSEEEAVPNWLACINHLLAALIPNSEWTVGALLAEMCDSQTKLKFPEVLRLLGELGLGLSADHEHGWLLMVPDWHPKLAEVFRGTRWETPAPIEVTVDGSISEANYTYIAVEKVLYPVGTGWVQ